MEIIIEKAPDIFIEVSEFFRKFNKTNNFISEINMLIKKNSNIIFPFISNIYSLINSSKLNENKSADSKKFYKPFHSLNQFKNFMNIYLIKKILFLSKNINNINEEVNLSEQDIFRNKQFSIKLLNYPLPKEKIDFVIKKIYTLYCQEKYENLFIEIIKINITNKYVFDFLLSNLSEEQKRQLFDENKTIIIKSIYGYSEINGYYFIEILLNNLEKCYPDKKFITNIIFPPKNKDEFEEMINYFNIEKFFLKTKTKEKENDEDKEENKEVINDKDDKAKYDIENDKKFLFNYSQSQNMVSNYETKAILFKYFSSSMNLINLFPELFYCFTKKDVSEYKPKIKKKKLEKKDFYSYFHHYYEFKKDEIKYEPRYFLTHFNLQKRKIKLAYPYILEIIYDINYYMRDSIYMNYFYKAFLLINKFKNKDLISSLNPFYFKIFEFIEIIYSKVKNYIENLKSIESKIFRFYIIIFIFNKIPYKLKNMIYSLKINNDLFNFDTLIKEDILKDKSNITEIEIFIILTLFEIKGEIIVSIKEYFPDFYNKIQNECNKYKELNIPEMNIRQSDDEKFVEGIKYLLNNDIHNFISKLKYNFNFYNLIFILEKNYNILNDEINSNEEYLEKIIYKLINNDENNSLLNINNLKIESDNFVKNCILSLKDFKKNSLDILNDSANDNNNNNIYLLFKNYNNYLLTLFSICNFVLRKLINNNEYELNLFKLDIFLQDYKDKFESMKKTILIKDIKIHILSLFNNLKLNKKDYFDAYISNWMDDYLNTKYIQDTFSAIEKENSSFIKYFKFLFG